MHSQINLVPTLFYSMSDGIATGGLPDAKGRRAHEFAKKNYYIVTDIGESVLRRRGVGTQEEREKVVTLRYVRNPF